MPDTPPEPVAVPYWTPQDALAAALRDLRDELRTRLAGLAEVEGPSTPPPMGRAMLDWDPDDVAVRPHAPGAAPVWWSQSTDRVNLNVDGTTFPLARDDRAVDIVRQVVEAAVEGRVERSRYARIGSHRVWLADGKVLERHLSPTLAPRVGLPPQGDWAPPYAERRDLLQRALTAIAHVAAGRAGARDDGATSPADR
ncbi:hypothetical protein J1G42_14745 [Cellulomonas sp. zg-ZUI222]|uniref:hypothetical protein n=1 Tax=Cellulomonas TaxID=1707 RepID=UPI001A93AF02|nr:MULTISPECIES: hypothetical protein [Cellulomonas]MBO0901839.1 hypothetical protein [Cellulomonas sp. zg-ZUI22]MBO0922080.1 hypothetical protein [Cellulomonas wangleii]